MAKHEPINLRLARERLGQAQAETKTEAKRRHSFLGTLRTGLHSAMTDALLDCFEVDLEHDLAKEAEGRLRKLEGVIRQAVKGPLAEAMTGFFEQNSRLSALPSAAADRGGKGGLKEMS